MSKSFVGFKIADYWHVEMYVIAPFLIFTIWWMWRVLELLQMTRCAI